MLGEKSLIILGREEFTKSLRFKNEPEERMGIMRTSRFVSVFRHFANSKANLLMPSS